MTALLVILAAALVIGKVARRITPVVQLLLIFLIGAAVAGEFLSWHGTSGGPFDQLRSLLMGSR